MSTMDLDVKTLQIQNERLLRAIQEVQGMLRTPESNTAQTKEFYTVEDCAELKGGAALNTFKSNRFLLPGCGISKFSTHIGGRLCFPKEEVLKWLKVSDEQYPEYAYECGISVIPDKYMRMFKKAKERAL